MRVTRNVVRRADYQCVGACIERDKRQACLEMGVSPNFLDGSERAIHYFEDLRFVCLTRTSTGAKPRI